MKRVTQQQIRRWTKVSIKRARRSLRSRRRRADLRRLGIGYADAARPQPSGDVTIAVRAPKVLSLKSSAYAETIAFFEAVRAVALRERKRVMLDLRRTEEISADVAPLMVAEVQRIRAMNGGSMISGLSPTSSVTRQRLYSLGIFQGLGMFDPISIEEGDDTDAQLVIDTGTSLDGEVSKKMSDRFSRALGLNDDQGEAVQKAFNEALENISEHAYHDPARLKWPAEVGRWWICCVTSRSRQGAFMLACDLGMTIPATVSETAQRRGPENAAELAKYLANNITKSEDERLLGAAFEEGVTRRPERKGGRGLSKMRALISEFPSGRLLVMSGRAKAMIGTDNVIKLSKLPKAFNGTYVLWHLGRDSKAMAA